jgi:hypothetical protein
LQGEVVQAIFTMKSENRELFETLIDKAEKLKNLGFIDHVLSIGFGFKGKRTSNDEWEIEFGLPEVKDRDAFLFTFRLFIQRNEKYSFLNLDKLIVDMDFSEEWRIGASKILDSYLSYLNGYEEYTVNLFDGHPTREEILRTVLYGGLGHTNAPDKIAKYRVWTSDDVRANLLMQTFVAIVINVYKLILAFSSLCHDELARNPIG